MKTIRNLFTFFAAGLTSSLAYADHHSASMDDFVQTEVTYEIDDTTFMGTIVYEKNEKETGEKRPGVLMYPNWMGPTEASLQKASEVASEGYVVMMVDMYGTDVRPSSAREAAEAAGFVRGDRELMRKRAAKAHEVFLETENIPLDKSSIAAIGFCFGGGVAFEYARSGADLKAVVSFHGDLLSPTLESDAGKMKGAILALHGADDPYVPQEDVQAWISAMRETVVDWQLVQFGNTVHSFTDPTANAKGQADYNPKSSKRAFELMDELFETVFENDD